ncbi:hypothetical protein BOTU111922_26070 [Bordetella tumulicola]
MQIAGRFAGLQCRDRGIGCFLRQDGIVVGPVRRSRPAYAPTTGDRLGQDAWGIAALGHDVCPDVDIYSTTALARHAFAAESEVDTRLYRRVA